MKIDERFKEKARQIKGEIWSQFVRDGIYGGEDNSLVALALQQAHNDAVDSAVKLAESKSREIIDMQTGLNSNPALEVAEEIRKLKRGE